jgi:hypothetical protein
MTPHAPRHNDTPAARRGARGKVGDGITPVELSCIRVQEPDRQQVVKEQPTIQIQRAWRGGNGPEGGLLRRLAMRTVLLSWTAAEMRFGGHP